ncbi:MAG: alpha/beta fold hydrolase [Acidimicrobiia bacterium]
MTSQDNSDRAPAELAGAWSRRGEVRSLAGHDVFTMDVPASAGESAPPLLVLHGFPSSSYDFATVLDDLARDRRVLLFDMLGYGFSAKPDLGYTMAVQADIAMAFAAEAGVTELALLSHDMGDTVGGELLARRGEVAGRHRQPRRHQRQHLHRDGAPHRGSAAAVVAARRAHRPRARAGA